MCSPDLRPYIPTKQGILFRICVQIRLNFYRDQQSSPKNYMQLCQPAVILTILRDLILLLFCLQLCFFVIYFCLPAPFRLYFFGVFLIDIKRHGHVSSLGFFLPSTAFLFRRVNSGCFTSKSHPQRIEPHPRTCEYLSRWATSNIREVRRIRLHLTNLLERSAANFGRDNEEKDESRNLNADSSLLDMATSIRKMKSVSLPIKLAHC